MILRLGHKHYSRPTAVEIVRALERDAEDYPHGGGTLRQFLGWSLARLGDRVPQRDLDLPAHVSDETLALGYLYLLDEYGVGELLQAQPVAE